MLAHDRLDQACDPLQICQRFLLSRFCFEVGELLDEYIG